MVPICKAKKKEGFIFLVIDWIGNVFFRQLKVEEEKRLQLTNNSILPLKITFFECLLL